MFDVSSGEFLIVIVLVLVLVGPEKIPEVARAMGKFDAMVRRLSNEFRFTMMETMKDVEKAAAAKEQAKPAAAPAPKALPAVDPVMGEVKEEKSPPEPDAVGPSAYSPQQTANNAERVAQPPSAVEESQAGAPVPLVSTAQAPAADNWKAVEAAGIRVLSDKPSIAAPPEESGAKKDSDGR